MDTFLWLLIPLGFVTGVYGTIVGLGGGFIIVPALLMLYPDLKNPELATSISLAVVCVNAISGSTAYARMQRIDYRSGITFALAAIPGSIIGAQTTEYIPLNMFQLVFGTLLILASGLLFAKPGKRTASSSDNPDDPPAAPNPLIGIILSIFVGFLSSLLGIGGGMVYVPAMVYVLHVPVHIATATSQFILAISSFAGTTTHLVTGTLTDGVLQVLLLACGVIFGAQVGARLSVRMQGVWIVRALALALMFVGVRFVFGGLGM
jgi:hypothetical protein